MHVLWLTDTQKDRAARCYKFPHLSSKNKGICEFPNYMHLNAWLLRAKQTPRMNILSIITDKLDCSISIPQQQGLRHFFTKFLWDLCSFYLYSITTRIKTYCLSQTYKYWSFYLYSITTRIKTLWRVWWFYIFREFYWYSIKTRIKTLSCLIIQFYIEGFYWYSI